MSNPSATTVPDEAERLRVTQAALSQREKELAAAQSISEALSKRLKFPSSSALSTTREPTRLRCASRAPPSTSHFPCIHRNGNSRSAISVPSVPSAVL